LIRIGLDGQRVIIYGGTYVNNTEALYVLNINNWEWYIPKISGNNFPTVIPYSHKANIIGKYMVVTFGK